MAAADSERRRSANSQPSLHEACHREPQCSRSPGAIEQCCYSGNIPALIPRAPSEHATLPGGPVMWIVKIALDRPYTFIVLALLILIISPIVIVRTPTDIFPNIDIPVISVAWQYTGLNPEEMEGRLTSVYERVLTTTVDNIEHIESTTVNGQAVVKIFLQPNTDLATANAQVTAISQTMLRQLPPGTLPPLIINYSASSVPILQLGLSGNG